MTMTNLATSLCVLRLTISFASECIDCGLMKISFRFGNHQLLLYLMITGPTRSWVYRLVLAAGLWGNLASVKQMESMLGAVFHASFHATSTSAKWWIFPFLKVRVRELFSWLVTVFSISYFCVSFIDVLARFVSMLVSHCRDDKLNYGRNKRYRISIINLKDERSQMLGAFFFLRGR